MGALAIPLAIAGGAVSAVGSVMAGREQSRASAWEKQQLNIQSQQASTAAAQSEARRREELTASLETIQAYRAGHGVALDSPTGAAILQGTTEDQERDMRTERLNYLLKSDQSRIAADFAGRRARTSLLAGFMGAGEAIASTGFKIASLGKGK